MDSHTTPEESRVPSLLTVLRKVLKVAVEWPLHLQDTAHRWDNARAIIYRLRTVRFRSCVSAC